MYNGGDWYVRMALFNNFVELFIRCRFKIREQGATTTRCVCVSSLITHQHRYNILNCTARVSYVRLLVAREIFQYFSPSVEGAAYGHWTIIKFVGNVHDLTRLKCGGRYVFPSQLFYFTSETNPCGHLCVKTPIDILNHIWIWWSYVASSLPHAINVCVEGRGVLFSSHLEMDMKIMRSW